MARKAKYTINGEAALSVTSLTDFIDSQWKEFWFRKYGFEECDRIRKESTEFGHKVHAIVEQFLRKEPYMLVEGDRVSTCAGLVIDWCKQAQLNILPLPQVFGENAGKPACEFEVVSKELMLVGHPDGIGTFGTNPLPWIIDWKTSKKMSLTYKLQVAAYAQAWFEMTGQRIDDAAIIRVEKDPNEPVQFETIEVHEIFQKFVPVVREAKSIYDFLKGKGKWKEAA